jgi:hypothetical protein
MKSPSLRFLIRGRVKAMREFGGSLGLAGGKGCNREPFKYTASMIPLEVRVGSVGCEECGV